jgi:hypothetical protein
MGGHSRINAVELSLAQAYVGSFLLVEHLKTKMLAGEAVAVNQYSQASSTLLRIGTRLLTCMRQRKDSGGGLGELWRLDDTGRRAAAGKKESA